MQFKVCALLALVAVSSAAHLAPTCNQYLEEHCERVKANHTECLGCVREYGKQGLCTVTQEELFCGIKPPMPPNPAKCYETLEADCGKERRNHTLCIRCADEHKAAIEKVNCTINEVNEFCTYNPLPPGVQKCFTEFEHFCAPDRRNKTMCYDCLDSHKAFLEHLNCTAAEAEKFCEAPQPPAPPPPAPHDLCYKTLYYECDKERDSEQKCIECAAKFERTDNCSRAEVDQFCHIGPKPGPVPPGEQCYRALYKDCSLDVGKPTCITCARAHEKSDNCTDTEAEEFCRIAPTQCSRIFEDLCGIDRHNVTMCDKCIEKHAANITTHKCSVAAGIEFCKGPPAPEPSDECTKVLREICGNQPKGTKCIQCESTNHEKTVAAKCTHTELYNFCKVGEEKSTFQSFVEMISTFRF